MNSLQRASLALALVAPLSGCIGALAIPLVAGGTLMARSKIRVHAATRARAVAASTATPNPRVTLLDVGKLPVPTAGEMGPGDPAGPVAARWREFFAYALSEAQLDKAAPRRSALLANGRNLDRADTQPCSTANPAVVIDLDNGREPFKLDSLVPAPAWLSEGLASLRAAGVTVLWITQLPAERAGDVAEALKVSRLDPDNTDQMLLLRTPDDRKQVLREDAEADVCIAAIMGDRQGDFDELFDYLRNPDAGAAFHALLGKGWFLAPAPGAATDSLPSWDAPAGG